MLHSNENAKELTWREHEVLESTDDNQAEKNHSDLMETKGLRVRAKRAGGF